MKTIQRFQIAYRSYLTDEIQTHIVTAVNGVVIAPLGLRPGWVGTHVEHIEARLANLYPDVSILRLENEDPQP